MLAVLPLLLGIQLLLQAVSLDIQNQPTHCLHRDDAAQQIAAAADAVVGAELPLRGRAEQREKQPPSHGDMTALSRRRQQVASAEREQHRFRRTTMRVLLVYPPISKEERYSSAIGSAGGRQMPLGVFYLASSCGSAGTRRP